MSRFYLSFSFRLHGLAFWRREAWIGWLGLAAAPWAWGAPGDALPPVPLTVESPGRVSHAHVTADQRVVLAGEFWSVNGTPVANFTRLQADGAWDATFRPALGMTEVANGSTGATNEPALQLFPLADGRLWVGLAYPGYPASSRTWTVLGQDGAERLEDFALPHEVGFVPQCESEGWLVLRQNTGASTYESALRRVSVSTGEEDAAFMPRVAEELPPFFVRPAGGGKLWVGGTRDRMRSPEKTIRSLYRLNEDGSKDTSFATKDYSIGEMLNIFPRPGEDVLAVFVDTRSIYTRPVYLERLGPEGAELGRAQLQQTSGANAPVRDAAGRVLLPSTKARPTWRRYSQEGVLDDSFTEVEADSAWPHLLTAAAEGKLLIDGTRRVLANGTPDPAWTVPDLRRRGGISELAAAPDGQVYAAGTFRFINNQPQRGLARFRADGTLDESFMPDTSLAPDFTQPTPLADGRLYVIEKAYDAEAGREEPRVVRLLANGTLDPSFAPFSRLSPGGRSGVGDVVRFAVFPDLSLLVTTRSGSVAVSFNGHRVRADGTAESGFATRVIGGNLSVPILTLPDGRFWSGARRFLANGTAELTLPQERSEAAAPLARLADGRIVFHRYFGSPGQPQPGLWATTTAGDDWDPSFVYQGPQLSEIPKVSLTADGKFYVCRPLFVSIRRYYADGRRDPTMGTPPLATLSLPPGVDGPVLTHGGVASSPAPTQGWIQSLQDSGQALWIAGLFTGIGSQRHDGLALLENGTPIGYAAWIAAVLRDPAHSAESRAEDADPDHDGAPNFLEYAAGTDPLAGDAALFQPKEVAGAPVTVAFYRNPDAPEITLVPEVSENGADWRVATAEEASLQSSTALRTVYQLAEGAPVRFVRGRYTKAP